MRQPSKWSSPSGKVHWRRLRFYIKTKDERYARPTEMVMLCGEKPSLKPVDPGEEVTCGICLRAVNTGAHLPKM